MAKNIFAEAKEKSTSSVKTGSVVVTINEPKFHLSVTRLSEIISEKEKLSKEESTLAEEVKKRGFDEFVNKFNELKSYPGTISIVSTGMKGAKPASFIFVPNDRYEKIGNEKFIELQKTFGSSIVEETTEYVVDKTLADKYGEILSDMIKRSKRISKEDKAKLIKATVSYSVKKGTLAKANLFGKNSIDSVLESVSPVFSVKDVTIQK